MGDTLCDYLLMTGHDLRDEKRTAGQLASIKVEFSKTFDNSEYTEKEASELYSELEKDVKKRLTCNLPWEATQRLCIAYT